MGLFAKFKAALTKTHDKLTHEIKRIVTRSPKLDAATLEEIEVALIGADLGLEMTSQIVAAVKKAYESQGTAGLDVLAIARRARRGESPFRPDKQHLHHRMLELGHSHRRAVVVMWLWAALIALGGVALALYPTRTVMAGLAVWFVITVVATVVSIVAAKPAGVLASNVPLARSATDTTSAAVIAAISDHALMRHQYHRRI